MIKPDDPSPPIFPSKETLRVEFKSDRTRLSDNELVEGLTCLANAEGGELCHLGLSQAANLLKRLRAEGKLVKHGERRGTYYTAGD